MEIEPALANETFLKKASFLTKYVLKKKVLGSLEIFEQVLKNCCA